MMLCPLIFVTVSAAWDKNAEQGENAEELSWWVYNNKTSPTANTTTFSSTSTTS